MRRYLCDQFTWDDDWVRPFESSYSVFRNIAKINGFHPNNGLLKKLIHTSTATFDEFYGAVPFSNYGRTQAVSKFNTLIGTDKNVCLPPQMDKYANETLLSHKLRGCPECLKLGFHSWMYQHKIIDRCPIHGVKLVDDIDWNLWDDHFKYLPGMNNLNIMPLQNVYDNGFKEVRKIYYQDFFGGIMTDEYVKVSTDIVLSGGNYEKAGVYVTHANAIKQSVRTDNNLSNESIKWLTRLTKSIQNVWNITDSDYITVPDAIRFILLTLNPETTDYTEASLNWASLELLIVSTTLMCELLSKYKTQIDFDDFPYLYMLPSVNGISSNASIIWNYLKAVRGKLDDTEILDFSNFKSNINYRSECYTPTFATIPYSTLPFWGFEENKIFIDCAEDMFWYQWEQYKNLFKSQKRIPTKYLWLNLNPISYIIIQRHDGSFDGYRVIGKNDIQKL